MKIRCLFGHNKRLMPKLWREGERDTGRPGPSKACTRCGKLWYDYFMWIPTIEGRRFVSVFPYYEGQTPPHGYDSWTAYRDAVKRGRAEWLEGMIERYKV